MTGCPMGETVAPPRPTDPSGIRSYEVFQRLRVHEASPVIRPRQLWNAEFREDPYPVLHAVREHTPCYRDWIGNAFWVTRYDDVTSVFVDDSNYETRTRRWWLGYAHRGRDLSPLIPAISEIARIVDDRVLGVTEECMSQVSGRDTIDLIADVVVPTTLVLWAEAFGVPLENRVEFTRALLRLHRGRGWDPRHIADAGDAFESLAAMFDTLLESSDGERGGVLAIVDTLDLPGGRITGDDLAATLCESDIITVPGSVANLFSLLIANPDVMDTLGDERRLWKLAWLETMRHSPPILTASRWARHEVERFGLLLPAGARVLACAGAANRDPRVFSDPDEFRPGRKDLCQREARGHYRADGLPSAISLGTGAPSRFPAVPEDRPRSDFARARDTAVTIAMRIATTWGDHLRRCDPAQARAVIRTDGGERVCWSIPIRLGVAT